MWFQVDDAMDLIYVHLHIEEKSCTNNKCNTTTMRAIIGAKLEDL